MSGQTGRCRTCSILPAEVRAYQAADIKQVTLRFGVVVVSDCWKPESRDVNATVFIDVVPFEADVSGIIMLFPSLHTAHHPSDGYLLTLSPIHR